MEDLKTYARQSLRKSGLLHAVVDGMRGKTVVTLDYPLRTDPRWGFGRPAHPALRRILEDQREGYARRLAELVELEPDFRRIDEDPGDESAPAWRNDFLPPRDAMALYGILAASDPRRYLEVGSGHSTRFARRAIRDHQLRTTITSIDPHPRVGIDRLCDVVIRQPLQDVDLSLVESLEDGDVLFFDGSHQALLNSDATVFFLEALPKLADGVYVHIHDISLPLDYPPEWSERCYSEQYLLAMLLLASSTAPAIVLPNTYIGLEPDLLSILDPVFATPTLRATQTYGSSFWIRTPTALSPG
jgi:hypothetical protein